MVKASLPRRRLSSVDAVSRPSLEQSRSGGLPRRVFRAGIEPSARRSWHGYFRDARDADDLYADLDAGLRGPRADRPLLTIFGRVNDPLRLQRRWKTLYPNARQVKVPRGNHFPMCDDPGLVASAVKAFAQKS
jgi:pimeloyl-ACP methyl ester carboxylesterase